MYEINDKWQRYFDTVEPSDRRALLDEIEENEIAKALYERRYVTKRKQEADTFLFNCIDFAVRSRVPKPPKAKYVREITRALDNMGMDMIDSQEKQTFVYWEIRNTIKRYIELNSAPGSRKKFFGLMTMSKVESDQRTYEELKAMSDELAEKLGMEETMELWNQAVRDEYKSNAGHGQVW